jgi:hypothetical protein
LALEGDRPIVRGATPISACKHALRSLARRWQQLEQEIRAHDQPTRQ